MTDWRITVTNGELVYEEKDERPVDEREYGGWVRKELNVTEGNFIITYGTGDDYTKEYRKLSDGLKLFLDLAAEGVIYHNLRFYDEDQGE